MFHLDGIQSYSFILDSHSRLVKCSIYCVTFTSAVFCRRLFVCSGQTPSDIYRQHGPLGNGFPSLSCYSRQQGSRCPRGMLFRLHYTMLTQHRDDPVISHLAEQYTACRIRAMDGIHMRPQST